MVVLLSQGRTVRYERFEQHSVAKRSEHGAGELHRWVLLPASTEEVRAYIEIAGFVVRKR